MEAFGITTVEGLWLALISAGIGHYFWRLRSQADERKEQSGKIHDLETEIAVLKSRETSDYNRLSGIEARLKALETCQSGMKADLAAIRAILEARPGKTPTPGSK